MIELSLALNEHQKVKLDETQFLVVVEQVRDIWMRSNKPHHHKDKGNANFIVSCFPMSFVIHFIDIDLDPILNCHSRCDEPVISMTIN